MSDPTIRQIMMRDSFGEIITPDYPLDIPLRIFRGKRELPDFNIRMLEGDITLEFCDRRLYDELQGLKMRFERSEAFEKSRDRTNPFEMISKSIFQNRASIKFANIDYVFRILNKRWTQENPRSDDEFYFSDDASGPGSFGQQIQWRYPRAKGIGMTLIGPLDFDRSILNENFEMYYGPRGNGDLLEQWADLLNHKLENYPRLDLVMGDGAFEIDDPSRISSQEVTNSELFIKQVVQVLALSKGGNCLFKLFDANGKFMADVLYCLSLIFDEVSVFKPCTSRPANSERYVVGMRKIKDDVSSYAEKCLYRVCRQLNNGFMASSFFEDLPLDFKEYLYEVNNDDLRSQIFYSQRILDDMKGIKVMNILVDVNLPLTLWAVPDPLPVYKPNGVMRNGQTRLNIGRV